MSGQRPDPSWGCCMNSRNGEMQQPVLYPNSLAVLFLLYRGEKGPKRGTLSVSWVFRGLRTSGQDSVPTPCRLLKKAGENFWPICDRPPVSLSGSSGTAAISVEAPQNMTPDDGTDRKEPQRKPALLPGMGYFPASRDRFPPTTAGSRIYCGRPVLSDPGGCMLRFILLRLPGTRGSRARSRLSSRARSDGACPRGHPPARRSRTPTGAPGLPSRPM